ncbi:MFS transporter [Streptomyces broussonetiae]|uniref:MFS transporter n=1 Tax=Streptomyces broussonetiae TaxID=2686304 RepID=UPI0035D9904E
MAWVTLASSTGKGIFLTAGVLYFTRAVGLPALQIGIAFSIAGFVSLVLGVPADHLADRHGPRVVLLASLALSAAATAAFLLGRVSWSVLLVVVLATTAQATLLVARGPIINDIADGRPQELRAYIRSVTNVGIAVGAVIAGWAAQPDTVRGYHRLVLLDSACFVVALLLACRLPRTTAVRPPATAGRRAALRDRPYLALSLLDGVLSIQYRVLTVALPLWVVSATSAPRWTVSAAVVANTAIIVLLQVAVSRRIDTPRRAAVALRRSGWAFCVACAGIAWAAGSPPWAAVALLALAAGPGSTSADAASTPPRSCSFSRCTATWCRASRRSCCSPGSTTSGSPGCPAGCRGTAVPSSTATSTLSRYGSCASGSAGRPGSHAGPPGGNRSGRARTRPCPTSTDSSRLRSN